MVREQWGQDDALIVTDCEATASMYQHNHLAADVADASAKSINAGVPSPKHQYDDPNPDLTEIYGRY